MLRRLAVAALKPWMVKSCKCKHRDVFCATCELQCSTRRKRSQAHLCFSWLWQLTCQRFCRLFDLHCEPGESERPHYNMHAALRSHTHELLLSGSASQRSLTDASRLLGSSTAAMLDFPAALLAAAARNPLTRLLGNLVWLGGWGLRGAAT